MGKAITTDLNIKIPFVDTHLVWVWLSDDEIMYLQEMVYAEGFEKLSDLIKNALEKEYPNMRIEKLTNGRKATNPD